MKTLIVDDSVFYRRLMSDIVGGFPQLTIVGQANSADEAIALMDEYQADLVFLDIVMPGKDGLTALTEIKAKYPKTQVVMVSSANRTQADITIKALSSGALDFIAKPEGLNIEENSAKLKAKIEPLIKEVIGIKSITQPNTVSKAPVFPVIAQALQPPISAAKVASNVRQKFDVVAIGVSTGGPDALQKVIPMFSTQLNVPIVLVQHMPPVFTASLAEHLNKNSVLEVKEAEQGDILKPNWVYVAPGGKHMTIKKLVNGQCQVELNEGPLENGCRPAVDTLLRSLPSCYEGRILSVIMTGLGSDGTLGVTGIKKHGAYCISQSAETCVVYGMPRSIDEAGLADESQPLEKIAQRIEGLVCRNRTLA